MSETAQQEEAQGKDHEVRAKAFVVEVERLIIACIKNGDASAVFKSRDSLVYELRELFGDTARLARASERRTILDDLLKRVRP
jgi:hypothetical protein